MDTDPEDQWQARMQDVRRKTVSAHVGISQDRIRFIDHHKAHASYAYGAAPHDPERKAAIVTADGWGDDCNATISVVHKGIITEIHRTAMCNMARMYRWTTLLLGMKPNEHEYKVMGLAPMPRTISASRPTGSTRKR